MTGKLKNGEVDSRGIDFLSPDSEVLNQVAERVLRADIKSASIQSLVDRMLEIGLGEQGDRGEQ